MALQVKLHPLVLLTITDFVTRHTLTKNTNKLLGVILGDQDGQIVSMRQAFESKTALVEDDPTSRGFDMTWVNDRIQQYRDVHKAPALGPVAVFVVGSSGASLLEHQAAVTQMQSLQGQQPVLLLVFHPDLVAGGTLLNDELPISIHRLHEPHGIDSQFSRVKFEVETDEAEFIGLGFVAAGASNARAIRTTSQSGGATATAPTSGVLSPGRNGRAAPVAAFVPPEPVSDEGDLTNQEEELVGAMTAQYNAVKMLRDRLGIIKTYLRSLPTCYLTDASLPVSSTTLSQTDQTLLWDISSLISRLPLLSLIPAEPGTAPGTTQKASGHPTTDRETEESADVALTTLLVAMTQTTAAFTELERKCKIVSRARSARLMVQTADAPGMKSGGGGGGGGTSAWTAGRKRGFGGFDDLGTGGSRNGNASGSGGGGTGAIDVVA